MISVKTDPNLDIVLDRVVDVSPELLWKAWTEPKHLMPWFCPAPWKVTACEIDLQPGGTFKTMMEGPAGEKQPVEGCYLEIVPYQRLSWTDSMTGGFRPKAPSSLAFTAIISFDKKGPGTRYLVQALHASAEMKSGHEKMGFLDGWGKALDQLVAYCKQMG